MFLPFGKTLLAFRLLIIIFLLFMFVVYFGIPSVENYFQYKTFFVESIRSIESSDLPVISVSRRTNETSKILVTCYNHTDFDVFMNCLKEMTEEMDDTILDARENFFFGTHISIKNNGWETSFMTSWYGRLYMLRQPYNLSNNDYMRLTFPDDSRYTIDFHDHRQIIEMTEQVKDFQKVSLIPEKGKRLLFHLDIEEVILLPTMDGGCNNGKNYSFVSCTKVLKHGKL